MSTRNIPNLEESAIVPKPDILEWQQKFGLKALRSRLMAKDDALKHEDPVPTPAEDRHLTRIALRDEIARTYPAIGPITVLSDPEQSAFMLKPDILEWQQKFGLKAQRSRLVAKDHAAKH